MSMDHPSVNAPTWSFWRLFSMLSLIGSAGWTLSRPLIIADNLEQMRELYLIIASTIGGAAIIVVGVLLAGGVRMGIAEASRLAAAPNAIRAATASFTPTRIGMRAPIAQGLMGMGLIRLAGNGVMQAFLRICFIAPKALDP